MGATRMKLEHHSTKMSAGIGSLLDVDNPICKFSDVALRCNKVGGKTFYCHKLVLQLNSDHFAKFKFSENFRFETIEEIAEEAFNSVLQFMYTGEIVLSAINIEALLSAAKILGMDDLKNICFQFMETVLIVDDAALCWRLALDYKQSALILKCQREVKSENVMQMLLSADSLCVKSEVDVCEILLKWIRIQVEVGNEINPEHLLPLIRWSGVSVDYVHAKLLKNQTLIANLACQNFLSRVISYMVSGIQFQGLLTFHRPSTGLNNCLIGFGLCDANLTSQDIYQISLQKKNSKCMLNKIPTAISLLSAACVVGDDVFVTGVGKPPYCEVWRLNPVTGWFRCADMLAGRNEHCVAIIDSHLYVLGGKVGAEKKSSDSIDCYQIKNNKWCHAGELILESHCGTSVTYMNEIYIFGGINAEDEDLSDVQVYSPHEEVCAVLDMKMPSPTRLLRAVLWEKSVILMNYDACFVFNFETQTFLKRKKYSPGLGYFGLLLDNETIFVVGGGNSKKLENGNTGWSLSDEIKTVAVIDVIKDKPVTWKHHGKLPKPSLVHSFGLICLPLNVQL